MLSYEKLQRSIRCLHYVVLQTIVSTCKCLGGMDAGFSLVWAVKSIFLVKDVSRDLWEKGIIKPDDPTHCGRTKETVCPLL